MSLQNSRGIPARNLIENALKSKRPTTVAQLAQIVLSEGVIDEASFVATLELMVEEGSIGLQEPSYEVDSPLDYLFTITLSGWFWSILGMTGFAVVAVILIPNVFPFSMFRLALGSVFVLYLPGHSLLRLLFPRDSEIDTLERFTLSVGLSMAIVPIIGLLLYFTPWGIQLAPITLSLGTFTVISATAAATHQYLQTQVK